MTIKNNSNDFDLDKYFARFALIPKFGMVVDREINKVVSIKHLRLCHPTMTSRWLASDNKMIVTLDKNGSYDLYPNANMPFTATAGKLEPIQELVYITCGENQPAYNWLMRWLAYPIQNIGSKMKTAPVFYGLHDPGKDLLVKELLCKMLPDRVTEFFTPHMLATRKNWASGKLLLIGTDLDEIKAGSKEARDLTFMIKHHSIRTTHKQGCHIWERSLANLIILSRQLNPPEFSLTPDGKEQSIYFSLIRQNRPVPKHLIDECMAYFNTPESKAAFANHLLTYDCQGFNAHSRLEN